MKFDVVVNAPMEPRTFPITAVIDGIPCIRVSTLDDANLPSETIKVYCGDGSGDATSQHDSPEGRVQEVHAGDFVGVLSKKSSSSPLKINSFYIVAIQNNQAITKNAIL